MDDTVYPDASGTRAEARQEYDLGLAFYRRKKWKSAARHFGLAARKSAKGDVYRHLYMSYQGFTMLCAGDVSGLNLCRHAAGMETVEADVFLNLALAELQLQHRKRACRALAVGLRIDPRHKGLLKLRSKIGMRRRPVIRFLKRDHPLNKWLGKATYRARMRTSNQRPGKGK